MSLLPPPGPQRTRFVGLLALLGLAVVVLMWRGLPWTSSAPAGAPPQASNPQNGPQPRAGTPGKPAPAPQMPVAVNLDRLEPVPDEPGVGRNLFRFGAKPLPPPPKPVFAPTPPPVAVEPPKPQGPPPIELQLKGITRVATDTPAVAWLKDPRAPEGSKLLSGSEGQIVDGKYKIVKVGMESVIVSYVDGTALRTILISKQ